MNEVTNAYPTKYPQAILISGLDDKDIGTVT